MGVLVILRDGFRQILLRFRDAFQFYRNTLERRAAIELRAGACK